MTKPISPPTQVTVVSESGLTQEIVPIGDSALLSSKIVKNATLKIYPGAPHGLAATHKEQLNADLLEFIKAPAVKMAG